MIFSKIWERYIFREFIKFVLFFLLCFYILYVAIDFSIHLNDFVHGKQIGMWKVLKYYGLQFIKRADILFPLATLIGTIKILCDLNTNKELVAFQSAGIHMKRLLRPLFLTSCLFFVINLSISQWATPQSLRFIDKFYDSHIGHSFRSSKSAPLHVMHLNDHTKLVYQYYDTDKEAFFDVIWIKNGDDLWRMKYLKADHENPHGEYVDHLVRNESGGFEKTESYLDHIFIDLSWNKDLQRKGFIPYENRSLTELWSLLRDDAGMTSYEKKGALTHLLFKFMMPFLCILAMVGVAPFCLKNRRYFPQFFLYSLSIFAFVAFVALMDAAVIIGESDTLSPYVAIFAPFLALIGIFGWRFAKA